MFSEETNAPGAGCRRQAVESWAFHWIWSQAGKDKRT